MDAIVRLATRDPMPPVRIAALEALADMQDANVAATVASLATDPESEVACAAIVTLGRIGGPAQEPLLLGLLDHGERSRVAAALEAIGRLRLHAAVPRVTALARESDDWELRVRAVHTLADIGGQDAVSGMLELARVGRLRRTVTAALRSLGVA